MTLFGFATPKHTNFFIDTKRVGTSPPFLCPPLLGGDMSPPTAKRQTAGMNKFVHTR